MSEDTGGRQQKIPSWDGSSESFQEYCEAAMLYEQTTKIQDRYLAAPRLIGGLQGAAKRLIVGQRPDWVSYNGGVAHLLDHLRKCLGKPQVPELTDLLAKYFKNSKRRQGELMGEYITRKCELYVRAQQSMNRIKPYHDKYEVRSPVDWTGTWNPSSRRSSVDSRTSTEGGNDGAEAEATQAAAPTASSGPTMGDAPSSAANQAESTAQNWGDWSWYGYGNGWNRSGQQTWNWYSGDWSEKSYYSGSGNPSLPELVPEFVQAWLLLQDAGLEPHEKNTVIVATQGEMTLQRVAQELRNQFADIDIKKRDASKKYHGYSGEPVDDSGNEGASLETSFNAEVELNEEGLALWSETEGEIQHAMATLHEAKRTLKNAREKQRQVKQSRQYFRHGSGGKREENHDKIICLRCGKAGHKAAVCPAPVPQASVAEMAPFICFAQDGTREADAWSLQARHSKPTTCDAVASGKAVIDCGATKSIGSVLALEQLMKLSPHGVSQVDTADRPVFGFGNSSEDRCVSTLHLRVQAGEKPGIMKIHALNRGAGPILLSVATLRALGAALDFGEGTMVLRKVDDRRLLTLEESQTGHLLLPLASDLLSGAEQTARPIPNLTSYLKESEASHQKPIAAACDMSDLSGCVSQRPLLPPE